MLFTALSIVFLVSGGLCVKIPESSHITAQSSSRKLQQTGQCYNSHTTVRLLQGTSILDLVGVGLLPHPATNPQYLFKLNPLTNGIRLSPFSTQTATQPWLTDSYFVRPTPVARQTVYNPWLQQYLSEQSRPIFPIRTSPISPWNFQYNNAFTPTSIRPERSQTISAASRSDALRTADYNRTNNNAATLQKPTTTSSEFNKYGSGGQVSSPSSQSSINGNIIGFRPEPNAPKQNSLNSEYYSYSQPSALANNVQPMSDQKELLILPDIKVLQPSSDVISPSIVSESLKSSQSISAKGSSKESQNTLNQVNVWTQNQEVSKQQPLSKTLKQVLYPFKLPTFQATSNSRDSYTMKQPPLPHCIEVKDNGCIRCESPWTLSEGFCVISSR